MSNLRVALAQVNMTVGDLDGNAIKIVQWIGRAREAGATLVVFPELAVAGYPPEDLLLKPSFIADNRAALDRVAQATAGITAIVGFVDAGEDISNAAAVAHDGKVVSVYHKHYLPNYGVFDENRYFLAGVDTPVFDLGGIGVGVNICEDIWYPTGPMATQALAGAELIVNISSSPFHLGKRHTRETMLATRAMDHRVFICYCNLVGGQDELVFDGSSAIFGPEGEIVVRGRQFEEDLIVADLDAGDVFRARLHDPRRRQEQARAREIGRAIPLRQPNPGGSATTLPAIEQPARSVLEGPAELYAALVLGTRDYVVKNGFRKVLVGLSGGIDSSLTAMVAADAVGPEQVVGVSMPSRYSSPGSKSDAVLLAENLGIELLTIPIEGPFQAILDALAPTFAGTKSGLAEENVQSRIRGNLLMAISNKLGYLVLTTGNKSEMATGYATLYGDMAGGFAVLKDVLKTKVYELVEHRNAVAGRDLIPRSVIDKEPSAELRPGQRDVDSLPPYPLLDPILRAYVEEDRSYEEIVEHGFDPATVRRVITMVDRSEYKRRQSPPGPRVTTHAFGKDRRLPITNGYRPV